MSDDWHSQDKWRMLVLAAAALAYPLTETSFSLATSGALNLEQKLVAWTTVTATMVTLLILPRHLCPVPRWQVALLAVPSVWLLGRGLLGKTVLGEFFSPVFYVVGLSSFALFFPFAIYLLIRVANPHLGPFKGLRQWSILVAICLGFMVTGYTMGSLQERFVEDSEDGLLRE